MFLNKLVMLITNIVLGAFKVVGAQIPGGAHFFYTDVRMEMSTTTR